MAIVHLGSVSLQVERHSSRQAFLEELWRQMEEVVRQVVTRCIEEALDAEVTALLERDWYERRKVGQWQRIEARCRRCGSQYAQDFRRDGHYPRHLNTRWGRLLIWVPQVECVCGGKVRVPWQTLRPKQRLWDDLEGEIRERYGWGMSLRWLKQWLDRLLGSSVGLRTLNERVRRIAWLVPRWQKQMWDDVPPVVRLDGLWITLMIDTGRQHKDRLGRQRALKRAQKVPILVAQGVWPEGGRQELVAWEIGRAEDEESWEALLTQMWERAIVPERGLSLLVGDGAPALTPARQMVYWDVPFQRCVFHKLRNIRRDILMPEGLEGQEARAYKQRFLRSAARIWQAPTEQEARKRQRRFCHKWQTQQPLAVATVCRDFEHTLAFYQVQAAAALRGEKWPAYRLRTTSPLERELRALRRRLSGAVLLHSTSGLMAIVHQLLVRRAAERVAAPPGTWQMTLERALAEAQRIS